MSLAVIDGDLISYISAAACEKRTIIAEHKASGRKKEFKNRTELKDFLKDTKFEYGAFLIEDVITPDPKYIALSCAKGQVASVFGQTGCENLLISLSGDNNFRDSLPLPSKYKSNRDNTIKPYWLKDVREYLKTNYAYEIAHGRESDDVLTSYQYLGHKTKERIVACSIDKDNYHTPGYLYDWNKMKKPTRLKDSLGELILDDKGAVRGWGRKWLYTQILIGDTADGYKPTQLCKAKYGEKAAYKALKDLDTDKACLAYIKDKYQEWYPEPFTYYAWDGRVIEADWQFMLQLYTDCAYMQRWEGDRFIIGGAYK